MTDKSVLEKYYDDEAKKRRAPTPEQDAEKAYQQEILKSKSPEEKARRAAMEKSQAIEPDTTLEGLLIGPGRVAAGAIAKSISKLANKAEIFMRPKVKNSIYPEMPGGKPTGQYAVRNIRGPEELEAIKQSSYMLPKEGGKQQKYFTQTDNMRTESNAFKDNHVLRVPIEKVPANRAVSRKNVERYNLESGNFEPLKKGGKVSSVSKRADGIAQRGKTKGRMV